MVILGYSNIVYMNHFKFYLFLLLSFQIVKAQDLSGTELLDKAITYHDPNGNWPHFKGDLNITMATPNNPKRISQITIDLPNQYFYVKAQRDSIITEYSVKNEDCTIKLNGSETFSEAQIKTHHLNCDRANLFKNYYTYLYGLPMKLHDEGTIIHDKVERKTFKGNDYLVLKVTYDDTVGSDVWYFYFDSQTYAMKVYQFFKTDDGKVTSDSGEYILLSEEAVINNIKIPKVRAWYYNKDDKYLGTDTLKS